VTELSEQQSQFQERLLDQTEEVHRANTQLEMVRRERDRLNTEHSEQIRQLVDERTHLQVYWSQLHFITREKDNHKKWIDDVKENIKTRKIHFLQAMTSVQDRIKWRRLVAASLNKSVVIENTFPTRYD